MANLSITPFPNPSGTQAWRLSGTFAGKRVRQNFKRLEQAQAALEAMTATGVSRALDLREQRLIQEVLAAGFDVGEVLKAGMAILGRKQGVKLSTHAQTFIKEIEASGSAGWSKQVRLQIGAFLKAHPEATTAMTRAEIARYLATIANACTRRHYRSSLTLFFSWLIERGYLDTNPAEGIKVRSQPIDTPPEILTPRQAKALMAATDRPAARRIRGWLALGLYAGLRPSEAERLVWAQVNLDTGTITLMGRKRGSQARVLTISKQLKRWLELTKNDGEPTPGFHSRWIREDAVRIANESLPESERIKWTADVLRHSFASYRAASGIGLHELAAQLGNSVAVIQRHYRQAVTREQAVAYFTHP